MRFAIYRTCVYKVYEDNESRLYIKYKGEDMLFNIGDEHFKVYEIGEEMFPTILEGVSVDSLRFECTGNIISTKDTENYTCSVSLQGKVPTKREFIQVMLAIVPRLNVSNLNDWNYNVKINKLSIR